MSEYKIIAIANQKVIPSNLDLSAMGREYTLKNCIKDIKSKYDYILMDTMPSLGMNYKCISKFW